MLQSGRRLFFIWRFEFYNEIFWCIKWWKSNNRWLRWSLDEKTSWSSRSNHLSIICWIGCWIEWACWNIFAIDFAIGYCTCNCTHWTVPVSGRCWYGWSKLDHFRKRDLRVIPISYRLYIGHIGYMSCLDGISGYLARFVYPWKGITIALVVIFSQYLRNVDGKLFFLNRL